MLYEFFIFGGLWFYILCSVEIVWLFISIASEKYTASTLSLISFILILTFFGNVNIISYVRDNPIEILKYIGVYFGGGVIWSFFKFYFYTLNIKRSYYNAKNQHMESDSFKKKDDEQKKESLNKFIEQYKSCNDIPSFLSCKSLILSWMSYWPISLIISLMADVVRNIFIEIREMFSGVYKKLYYKILGDMLKEIE